MLPRGEEDRQTPADRADAQLQTTQRQALRPADVNEAGIRTVDHGLNCKVCVSNHCWLPLHCHHTPYALSSLDLPTAQRCLYQHVPPQHHSPCHHCILIPRIRIGSVPRSTRNHALRPPTLPQPPTPQTHPSHAFGSFNTSSILTSHPFS